MAALQPGRALSVLTWGAAGQIVASPGQLDALGRAIDSPTGPLAPLAAYLADAYGPAGARIMTGTWAEAMRGLIAAGGISRSRAAEITCPALLITGSDDEFCPPGLVAGMAASGAENSLKWRRRSPGSRLARGLAGRHAGELAQRVKRRAPPPGRGTGWSLVLADQVAVGRAEKPEDPRSAQFRRPVWRPRHDVEVHVRETLRLGKLRQVGFWQPVTADRAREARTCQSPRKQAFSFG